MLWDHFDIRLTLKMLLLFDHAGTLRVHHISIKYNYLILCCNRRVRKYEVVFVPWCVWKGVEVIVHVAESFQNTYPTDIWCTNDQAQNHICNHNINFNENEFQFCIMQMINVQMKNEFCLIQSTKTPYSDDNYPDRSTLIMRWHIHYISRQTHILPHLLRSQKMIDSFTTPIWFDVATSILQI